MRGVLAWFTRGFFSVEDVDFGFTWRDPQSGQLHQRPPSPRFAIYKLHGSLNWLRCALCEHTYVTARTGRFAM